MTKRKNVTSSDEEERRVAVSRYLRIEFQQWWNGNFDPDIAAIPDQKAFADYLGVSPPSLSRWMTGQGLPDERQKAKIADKLGRGIYDAAGTKAPIPDDPDAIELLESLPKLKSEQRERIRAQMRAFVEENEREERAGDVTNGLAHAPA